MKLIPAAERPKRSQSPCPTNRNQHRQTVLLVEFNSTPTPAVYFLPPSSHRGKQRRLVVEGRNPAPYGPQTDRHFIPLLQHNSECLSS